MDSLKEKVFRIGKLALLSEPNKNSEPCLPHDSEQDCCIIYNKNTHHTRWILKTNTLLYHFLQSITSFLLQRNELRTVSRTNTRAVMLHRSISKRELAQVVTNHLSLNLNVVEVVTIVHTNNTSNHLGNNNHVTQMSLHRLRTLILTSRSLLFY